MFTMQRDSVTGTFSGYSGAFPREDLILQTLRHDFNEKGKVTRTEFVQDEKRWYYEGKLTTKKGGKYAS